MLALCAGWSADHYAIARELRLSSSSGVLLHGPAGCGKSMLVKAIAADFSASLHTVVASEIFDAVTGSFQLMEHFNLSPMASDGVVRSDRSWSGSIILLVCCRGGEKVGKTRSRRRVPYSYHLISNGKIQDM